MNDVSNGKTAPSIDILLSVYNGEKYLAQLLSSLENQTCHDFRLVIRNDGSSDGSFYLLEQFAHQTPLRCRLHHRKKNLGVIPAYNWLMKKAAADYIMFCDQDDVWLPEKVEKSLRAIQEAEDEYGRETPLLLHCDLRVVDKNLKLLSPSMWRFQHLNAQKACSFEKLLVQNVVTGCAAVFNRALARKVPHVPDEAVMHDWFLALAASAYGRVIPLPEALLLYRRHEANTLGPKRYSFFPAKQALNLDTMRQIRKRLSATFDQAKAFDAMATQLSSKTDNILKNYLALPQGSFFERRLTLLRKGFFKNGFWRNLGLFLFI